MHVDYELIGQRIKEARKKNHKTQEQLSELLSVTVGYISQIERGYTKINLEMIAKICELLDCDVAYMLTGIAHDHSSYKNYEITNLITQLSSNEKSLVLDIINSIIKNR